MTDADLIRRCALGSMIRTKRGHEGISVETLAQRAQLGHMTLRRVEEGHTVRPKSYAALERALELPTGCVSRALLDDDALIELAGQLGIAGPDENQSPAAWLRSFALPTSWTQQLGSQDPGSGDDLPAVGALVAKLSARKDRTPAEDAALKALAVWLAELT